ncbi:MAG: S8 family serine peptidase [Deinococcaceae bacterium]
MKPYAVTIKRDVPAADVEAIAQHVRELPSTTVRKSLFGGHILLLSSTGSALSELEQDPRLVSVTDLTEMPPMAITEPNRNTEPKKLRQVQPMAPLGGSASVLPPWPKPWKLSGEYTYGLEALGADVVHSKIGVDFAGQGVGVCILDSGLDINHPEFKGINLKGYLDFLESRSPIDPISHGTHVAGTIVAPLGEGAINRPVEVGSGGVVGIAPNVNLYVGRILRADTEASVLDWWGSFLSSIDWCTNQLASRGGSEKHMVMNLSLGGIYDRSSFFDPFEFAFEQFALDGGITIAGAGNDTFDISADPTKIYFPAGLPSVVAVSSISSVGQLSWFSNFGSKIDLAAPGEAIFSTATKSGGYMIGTMSAKGLAPFNTVVPARKSVAKTVKDMDIVAASRGTSELPGSLCDGPDATLAGKIALIYAWKCPLKTKVDNAVKSGALALILHNIDDDMGAANYDDGKGGSSPIPVVLINYDDGQRLKNTLPKKGTVSVTGSADYAVASGTSMAAPHVTGAAALVWSQKPSLTASELLQLLKRTATDLGASGKDDEYGYGVVNPLAAIEE